MTTRLVALGLLVVLAGCTTTDPDPDGKRLKREEVAWVDVSGRDSQTLEIDPSVFMSETRLQGCIMGSSRFRTDLPHYIELDMLGRIDVAATIEGHIELGEINAGYEAMRQRSINGRRVIMFPT